jgi:DNA repair exonuclease SbcCD ATPase subunit
MLGFLRNFVGVKSDNAVQAGVEALVRWDPEGASEAELRTMEQNLDELGQQVARARQAYDKERQEADQIEALSRQRMAAAEQLQGQIAAESDPARRAALERSLETLVKMLEEMTPEVEREKKDAADAKDFLDMLENAYAEAGGKLKSARSELDRARRDMVRAGQQRDTAERQAEAARQTAGLTRSTSGLNVALQAMHDAAQRDLASADAAAAKAKLLRPTRPEQEDPNIAAALAAAAGKSPAPQNLSERLAALRARAAG